jgi:hypothetical protein
MLDTIREGWGWIGLVPAAVTAENAFGNLIVRDTDGTYWRICPEELSCERVARNAQEIEALFRVDEFLTDWEMTLLVEQAQQKLGPVPADRCYCLKLPAVIGGKYDAGNIGTIPRAELIAFAGDLARQIKDVADGEQIVISVVR